MGIATVAVHSTADADAMHVRLADESVCIGPRPGRPKLSEHTGPRLQPPKSPMPMRSVPATGFLSENAKFAEIVKARGMTFIGPKPEHIRLMGDKIAAKTAMGSLGVPMVPGVRWRDHF